MADPEIPTSYDELRVKYQQLLEENAALRTLKRWKSGKKLSNHSRPLPQTDAHFPLPVPDEQDPTAATIPHSESQLQNDIYSILDQFSPINAAEEAPFPHPFLHEPILRRLSWFLDHSSLRACRLVCSPWYVFMTPSYLKKSKIVVQFCRNTPPRGVAAVEVVPGQPPVIPDVGHVDNWLHDSSDSDEEMEGLWKTLDNFSQVYPYPVLTEVDLDNPKPKTKSMFDLLRKFYWECKSTGEQRPGPVEVTVATPNPDTAAPSGSGSRSTTPRQVPATSSDSFETQVIFAPKVQPPPPAEFPVFDLGLDLTNKEAYIPPPPVPDTVELIGFACPAGWLQTYGYLVKTLSIDFGNFQRRERYGDVDAVVVVRLLRDFCPNVETLRVQKPNYSSNMDVGPPPSRWRFQAQDDIIQADEEQGPSQNMRLPRPNAHIMATARFENISTLEVTTYRSDRVECGMELIASTPNVKHFSLSLFSVAPEVETQFMEAAERGGYLQNLETLKLPLGIKSTTLVFLAAVEFTQLKTLLLGRIRQTRWIRGINQPPGQLVPLVDPATLVALLQNVSSTLEDLSLSVNLTHPDEIGLFLNSQDIPVLPHLRRLEYKSARAEFTGSFSFLDNLPSLSTLELTGEIPAQGDDLISRKLLPETFLTENSTLTRLILVNMPVDFPGVVKLARNFQRIKVLHLWLALNSSDPGNANVRRPLSRYLFKLRKLLRLEELRIKCNVIERDDFGYSVGFCLRHMRALKRFAFHSLKTRPRLTPFAVDMGFGKAPSLLSVELEEFVIYEEDKSAIETALKKKLLHTKLINCLVVNPLKNCKSPNLRFQEYSLREDEPTEKWSFEMNKYTDFESLGKDSDIPDVPTENPISPISFSASDTESLEFAIASF